MNNEVINYLLAYKNMKIIQRKDMFNFSLDTVLLANFCTINKDLDQIVDFGTNNAAIPLLLSKRTDKKNAEKKIFFNFCIFQRKSPFCRKFLFASRKIKKTS